MSEEEWCIQELVLLTHEICISFLSQAGMSVKKKDDFLSA